MDETERNKQEHMMAIRSQIDTNKEGAKGKGSKKGKGVRPRVSIRFKTVSHSKEAKQIKKGRSELKKGKRRKKQGARQVTPGELIVIRSFLSFLMAFLPALISHPKILRKLTKMVKTEVRQREK